MKFKISASSKNKLCCPVSTSGVCCIILIGFAITSLVFFVLPDYRTEKINKYNDAVKEWQNSFSTSLDNLQFSVSTSFNNNPQTPLILDTSSDPINDKPKNQEVILKYDPKKFISKGQVIWFRSLKYNNGLKMSLFLNKTGKAYVLHPSIQIFKTTSRTFSEDCYRNSKGDQYCIDNRYSKCVNSGGSYQGLGVCYYFNILRDICISFNPNTETQGTGCFGSPEIYVSVSSNDNFYDGFGNLILRHEKDPYIALLSITGGSLNFGLSKEEMNTLGGVFLGLGIAVIAVIFISCIFTLVICCKWILPDLSQDFKHHDHLYEDKQSHDTEHVENSTPPVDLKKDENLNQQVNAMNKEPEYFSHINNNNNNIQQSIDGFQDDNDIRYNVEHNDINLTQNIK